MKPFLRIAATAAFITSIAALPALTQAQSTPSTNDPNAAAPMTTTGSSMQSCDNTSWTNGNASSRSDNAEASADTAMSNCAASMSSESVSSSMSDMANSTMSMSSDSVSNSSSSSSM